MSREPTFALHVAAGNVYQTPEPLLILEKTRDLRTARGLRASDAIVSLHHRLFFSLAMLAAPLTVVGCTNDMEHAGLNGTLKSDGWALFSVDNDRQQHNDVAVTLKDVDPGATYVLIYAPTEPPHAGWFLFDPTTRERCGGDVGPHCEIHGYGYMVDVQTATSDTTELTLRDDQCGCDGDHPKTGWTGHWAVMRVERTARSLPVRVDVWAKSIREYAVEPDIQQLQ